MKTKSPAVEFSVRVKFDLVEFIGWPPENVAALLNGIGSVVAVQTTRENVYGVKRLEDIKYERACVAFRNHVVGCSTCSLYKGYCAEGQRLFDESALPGQDGGDGGGMYLRRVTYSDGADVE